MNIKSMRIMIVTLVLAFLSVFPVSAGNWATVSLDYLPETVVAGERLEIGFVVRQHGVSPMADLIPTVLASHPESGDSIQAEAHPQGEVGHYVTTLNFPRAGSWKWSIRAFRMDQSMPQLVVIPAPSRPGQARIISLSRMWIVGFGLTLALAAGLLFFRKRHAGALLLLIVALLFTGGGFALAANQPTTSASEAAPARSLAERGEALFLAKGCITCHKHTKITSQYDVESGISGPAGSAPDLTRYSSEPAFLRNWLADPTQVKASTGMPDLGLTGEEIEALMAFLNSVGESPADALASSPKESCPVTQAVKPPFFPPAPYPPEPSSAGLFWYGTGDLWTMLPVDGAWRELPYHDHDEGNGHYGQKVVWWNDGYDWQTEPQPDFKVTARRLDGPVAKYATSEATNLYHPVYGAAILTGVEIPTLGCWEFTGSYQGHELSFVVRVEP